MGKAEWDGDRVCWWLGFYFCFVCCLDKASCTGCYWWLGDAWSCIQVVSFVWVLIIWYSLGLVLWEGRVLESVLPLQRLRAWSWDLCGSVYSFLLVRYSCVDRSVLSWCSASTSVSEDIFWSICGERCIPCPSTHLLSCSPVLFCFVPLSFLVLLAHKVVRPRGLSACTLDQVRT